MPNFGTSGYVLHKIALLQKQFWCVFMRHSIQTFCFKFLVVYSAKHRQYQLVAKSTVPCFFKLVLFSQCRFFHCGMPTLCPRIWGGEAQRKFGGTLKSFPALCAPNIKTVPAPMQRPED